MFTFLGRTLHMQNKPMWKWIMGKAQLLCTFVFCIVSPWCLELPKLLTTVDKLCPRASVRGSENISINWLGNITGLKWQLAGNIRYSLSQLRQYRIYLYYLYSFSKYLLSACHVYQASVIPTQMKKKIQTTTLGNHWEPICWRKMVVFPILIMTVKLHAGKTFVACLLPASRQPCQLERSSETTYPSVLACL